MYCVIHKKPRVLNIKQGVILELWTGALRTGTCFWCNKSAGFRAVKGSGETPNGERILRGSQGGAHRRWRQRGANGFEGPIRRPERGE
jgi:hypothetical protein